MIIIGTFEIQELIPFHWRYIILILLFIDLIMKFKHSYVFPKPWFHFSEFFCFLLYKLSKYIPRFWPYFLTNNIYNILFFIWLKWK